MKTDVKIKMKLFIGFGIIIAASAVVALTAFYAISSLNTNLVTLLDTRIPQIKGVGQISLNIANSALHMDEAVLADAPDVVRSELGAMVANKKNGTETLDMLKATLTTDKEKALLQNVTDRRASYFAVRDKIIGYLNEGKKVEAQRALGDVKPLRTAYQAALGDLQTYIQETAKVDGNATMNGVKRARLMIVALVIASMAVAGLVAFWIVSSITKPLYTAVATADRIADRDLTVEVTGIDQTETGQLMAAMNNMVQNLRDIVSQTTDISQSIATSSSHLHATSEEIANGAEQVALQTQTVATASEEMSATSNDIAANCHEAARNSQQASNAAEAGAQVVSQTVEIMNRIADRVNATSRTVESLGERSDQIGAIVGTIEDIADQTNLLALNAAIEAARAGEQGRGFAVVADEVRALAERTTKATREISEMIKAIQAETKGAVSAMEEGVREVKQGTEEAAKSGNALQEILDQINAVSMQVNQIATAAEEQTATISEITGNITRISDVVQRTAQGSQDSSVAAAELASLSDNLSTLVTQFKLS
ncbi:methyl-accepting chemotaxis protein [Geomonas sp. Red32]|uniref:methyl-accepting chemotaxis protein n=1 Tax=Geomonas sp. Red32 TaxID=2912856 RepID=UPI00202D0A12|nr:methyl-accepting chemotaxis protein [Geomonas sp. Red32]MCM0081552.1 methyl-accepting chemotaxis protein [Geomonas sp. Red32]